ncbi:hypothetical protein MUGA111182_18210 [Mucilaginibacter galii]|nr:hypothetical protein [Mucilaginibacter galii]
MWIIEEDYESEFRYKHRPIPALKGLDTFGKVIHIGYFNRTIFSVLRIGYMVLPTVEMAQHITMIKAMTDRQDGIIDHAILTKFIVEGHFLRHLRRMRLIYKKLQTKLISLLKKHFGNEIRITSTDAGMHIIVWFLNAKHPENIPQLAKEIGMVIYAVD